MELKLPKNNFYVHKNEKISTQTVIESDKDE